MHCEQWGHCEWTSMVAMETYLLLISVLALTKGQNYSPQGTILRAGQNGRPQSGPPYYDDGARRPNPGYTPFNSNNNYNNNNRQRFNRYPSVRQNGPNYNDFDASGAHADRYDVTPRGYDVTPRGYDVTPRAYGVTPYGGAADDTFQANPTQSPTSTTTTATTATTTTTTTTPTTTTPEPQPKHNHEHDHKDDDGNADAIDNSIKRAPLELTDSTQNDTDDSVEAHPSSHVQTDENGHYGAFHASAFTTILVSYWKTDNPEELFFSCLGIAALAVFYEGMAALKDWLVVRFTNNYQSKASCRKTLNYCGLHLAKSFVYMIQLTSAYLLMLIAMTYNIYLFVAVILGSGIGHVLFSVISYRSQASANM